MSWLVAPSMNPHMPPESALTRRRVLGACAATLAVPLAAAQQATVAQPLPLEAPAARVALLVGNRYYPGQMDLPSMHSNVRRLQAALEALGFAVTSVLDQDRAAALASVSAFSRQLQQLPAEGVSLFYFCGHGMQVDAENFLLPAHVFPREMDLKPALDTYVALWQHVLNQLPRRPAGLSMTVVDACRTSPKALSKDDGLNQVRAPDGELIVFSTGAGKPALAPLIENRLTFFTEALVARLQLQAQAPEEISFPELFRLVGTDVQRTMRAHPLEDIRALTQEAFIADSTRRAVRVSLRPPPPPPEVVEREKQEERRRRDAAEAAALEKLRGTLWPRDVVSLATDFEQRFPDSRFRSSAQVSREGAVVAAKVLADPDIGLSRRDFEVRSDTTLDQSEDLRRAARGDKDAAARVGERVSTGDRSAGPAALQFEAWMKYAGLLGNGIAAYELARHYARVGQGALSGQWVSRARKLGYVPPAGLRIGR